MLRVAVVLTLVTWASAAIPADEVLNVPYLEPPQPSFKHYSGYLDTTTNKSLWYWFVESENDPANDPVVMWLNGGPGCSSMTGKLTEIGPWRSHSNGTLTWFDWNWNKKASLLFFDSPQCVGFSYNSGWEDIPGYCVTSDDQTAMDNHAALTNFFAGFPEYASNDFYVFGESYAGYYVPVLSARLVDDPFFDTTFKGMAIDNGVCNEDMLDSEAVVWAFGHGLIGVDLYSTIIQECCPGANATDCLFTLDPLDSALCRTSQARVMNVLWNIGTNPYNLYEPCYPNAPNKTNLLVWETETEAQVAIPDGLRFVGNDQWTALYDTIARLKSEGKTIYSGIPCTDTSNRANWLNKPDVREALHIPTDIPDWDACSDDVIFSRQYSDVTAEHIKVLNSGRRVMIFWGDTDQAVNQLGGLRFAEHVNNQRGASAYSDYTHWLYNSDEDGSQQVGGFVKEWTSASSPDFTFITALGAGHMVPTDKPKPGYILFDKFINNVPWS